MLFPTLSFFAFFVVVFLVYWAMPRHRLRLLWLLAASCFFYMSWNPWLILLLFASTAIDFLVARRLAPPRSPAARRALLTLSIIVNLGILAYFKYALFVLGATHSVLSWFGVSLQPPLLKVILPLGISFYTFEAVSYVVDVYRHKIEAIQRPLDYALYILFFPHLVAGPIVRGADFLPQLQRAKRFSWPRLLVGVQLILLGLFKKAVIADHLAAIVDPVFARPSAFASSALWLAALGYAVQIYCDFSGYSDMAVGLAHTLGFKLPMNFNCPYLAAGLADFWRRWHISLSSWLRDYLYIPLGGNRGGRWAAYRNLLLTMVLGGLWHGANWTFVVWGLYHGLLLAWQRAWRMPRWWNGWWTRPFTVAATFVAVVVGWVLFRAQTFTDAAAVLRGMLLPTTGLTLPGYQPIVVIVCLLLTLAGQLAAEMPGLGKLPQRLPAPLTGAALAGLLLLYFLCLPLDSRGFIYFRF